MTEFIGLKIKQLMKQKGIGNKTLAELSGLPIGTLNKIIYGDTKSPTLDNIQAIAKVLGCTLDDFVEESLSETVLSFNESELLNAYKNLNEEGQEDLLKYARLLASAPQYKKDGESELVQGA